MTKSDPIQLGKNDAEPSKNPGGYRLTPRLGSSTMDPGTITVQPEEVAKNNSMRTGHNDRQRAV